MSVSNPDGSMRLPPYTDAERREIKGAIVSRFRADLSRIGPKTAITVAEVFYCPVEQFPELAEELQAKLIEIGRQDIWESFEKYRRAVKDKEDETLRNAAEWLRNREKVNNDWKKPETMKKSSLEKKRKLAALSQSKTAS